MPLSPYTYSPLERHILHFIQKKTTRQHTRSMGTVGKLSHAASRAASLALTECALANASAMRERRLDPGKERRRRCCCCCLCARIFIVAAVRRRSMLVAATPERVASDRCLRRSNRGERKRSERDHAWTRGEFHRGRWRGGYIQACTCVCV